jgi:hypothetical protein
MPLEIWEAHTENADIAQGTAFLQRKKKKDYWE